MGGRFVMVRCWKRPAGLEKHSLAKGEGISKGGTLARLKGCNCGRRVIRPMLESRPATITKRLQSRITPQSGLANGPEWAALKKHYRMRTTDACVPDLVEVLEQEWWDCDNALAPIPMNRPSVALGDRDDR